MSIIHGLIGSIAGGGGGTPTFNVTSFTSPINEGDTGYLNYSFTNQPSRTLYWTISNATTVDQDFAGLRDGTINVSGNGSGNFAYTAYADQLTEGDQYFYIYIGTTPGGSDISGTTTVHINDTSTTPPLYNWSPFGGSQAYVGNGYISYNNSALAAGTTEFAFEALVWINSATRGGHAGGAGFILGQGDGWQGTGDIAIWCETDRFYVKFGTDQVSVDNIDTSGWYDKWFRLAVARCSDGYVNIFKNGVRISRSTQAYTNNLTNTQFDLGWQRSLAPIDNSYAFHGNMTNIHFNTDATYVNTKFDVSSYTDESATFVTKTTGTQLLVDAADVGGQGLDFSNNHITATFNGTEVSWSRRNPVAAPVLWLDGYYSESYATGSGTWVNLGSTTNSATLYNNPSFNTQFSAYVFDSRSNQWADGDSFGSSTYNTASAWVRIENFGSSTWPPSNTSSSACVFTEAYLGAGYSIAFALGGNLTFTDSSKITAGSFDGTTWHTASPSYTPSIDTWYHLTMTQGAGGAIKFYINGTEVATGTGGSGTSSGGRYRIARRWDNNEYFPGTIGSIQKYHVALTSDQVLTLFNSQKARFFPPAASFTMSGGGSVDEGQTATFTVTTVNVDDGTTMYWAQSAGTATASDVSATSGLFTINSNAGSFTISITDDHFVEGIDTMTIAIGIPGSDPLFSDTLAINDNTATPPSLVQLITSNIPTSAGANKVWTTFDSSNVNRGSMIHGSWSRNGDYTTGGAILSNDTYIEMPVNVDTNTFTISLVTDITVTSGWQSIFSTGDLTTPTGYHCYYITSGSTAGNFILASNYGTGSQGLSTFECTQADLEARANWTFVIDTSSSDASQIYRNGVALNKTSSGLVTPNSYGSQSLIFGNRRQGGSINHDPLAGTIYRILAVPTAMSSSSALTEYNNIKTTYDI